MNPPEPQHDHLEQTIKAPARSECKFVLSSKENKRRVLDAAEPVRKHAPARQESRHFSPLVV